MRKSKNATNSKKLKPSSELSELTDLLRKRTSTGSVNWGELEEEFFRKPDGFLAGARYPATHPTKPGQPVELTEYEEKAIRAFFHNSVSCWEWGRQCGKTQFAALLVVFLSQQLRGDVIVISHKQQRSVEFVAEVRKWAASHADTSYYDTIMSDANDHIWWKTDSSVKEPYTFRVVALAHGEVANSARGFTVRLILSDETELMGNDDRPALLPTGLTIPDLRRLHLGTVYGQSTFWWEWVSQAEKLGFYLSKVTSEEALFPKGPVIKERLDELKQTLGDAAYQQECLLIPIPDVGAFYGLEVAKLTLLEGPHPEWPKESPQIVSWDPAPTGADESAVFVGRLVEGRLIEETVFDVVKIVGVSIAAGAEYLSQKYPNAMFEIDATAGVGMEALYAMQRKGLDVYPFKATSQTKMQIHVKAKSMMQEGLVGIFDKKLFDQIAFYRYEETSSGKYKLGEKSFPDDRLDALVLACDRALTLRGGYGPEDENTGESAALFVSDSTHSGNFNLIGGPTGERPLY